MEFVFRRENFFFYIVTYTCDETKNDGQFYSVISVLRFLEAKIVVFKVMSFPFIISRVLQHKRVG